MESRSGIRCATNNASSWGGQICVRLARQDTEPLLRLLLGREFAVVLEDDRGRIARLERNGIGALHEWGAGN